MLTCLVCLIAEWENHSLLCHVCFCELLCIVNQTVGVSALLPVQYVTGGSCYVQANAVSASFGAAWTNALKEKQPV